MKKISIRKFFIFYILVTILLPLLLFGSVGVIISSGILKKELSNADDRQVHLIAESIRQYLTDPREELNILIELLNGGFLPDSPEIEKTLTAISKSHEKFLILQIANRKGTVLSVYPPNDSMIGTDVSGHEYFKETIQNNNFFWAPSFMSEQIDKPVTSLSLPYKDGIVTGFLSLARVGRIIDENTFNSKSDRIVLVTDQNGIFIAHPDKDKVISREYDHEFIKAKKLWEGNVLNHIIEYETKKYMAHILFMADSGWKIALYQPLSSYYAPLKTMVAWFIFLTISLISFAALLGNIFSSEISQSIKTLLSSARKISKGNYQISIPPVKYTELDNLATSFKKMVGDVRLREETIKKGQDYIASIINSMPSMIICVDANGIVTQWNEEAEKRTGVSVQDAIGQPLEVSIPRMADELERIKLSISKQIMLIDPKKTYQENDELFYEDITIYPLITDTVDSAVIRVDDVTEQVRMETMVVQSEKMLSLGGLAAGMAHEINNPLSGIMQTTEVLKNRLTNFNMPSNQRAAEELGLELPAVNSFMEKRGILRMVETINSSSNRVAEIVENMLCFARKENASFSLHNPVELLDKILDLAATDYDLKKQYDFKTIEIKREYEDDLPLIPCEGSKIQQVFLNILRNGAHAMQDSKKNQNEVNPRFILRLLKETSDNMIRIEIEDNGPGMDESTSKRIFEPFFTTKPVGIGTGLGLSVSYFIITENHAGEMSVESTLGVGTKFIIRLPIERKNVSENGIEQNG